MSPTAARLGATTAVRTPVRLNSSRAALIKELRAITSAPMKKCVDALAEANGDVQEAVTLLRKAGLAAAAKKAGRGASEGAAAIAYGSSGEAALMELNSETDFVARNEIFQELCSSVARTALGVAPASGDAMQEVDTAALGASQLGDGQSVTEALGVAVSQLGENLVLRRACLLSPPASGGVVAGYVHNAYAKNVGKTAAAVVLASSAADTAALRALGEKLSMHVVAATPQFLDSSSVDAAAMQRERDFQLEQAKASGKPDHIAEKMVEGRMKKYYADVCLVDQTYMIDETAGSVRKVLEAAGKELGAPVSLAAFVRYTVGEGVEVAAEEA